MIYLGNLTLRTMVIEYFNNSLYIKIYERFFSKISFCTMVQKPFKTKKKNSKKYIEMFLIQNSKIM